MPYSELHVRKGEKVKYFDLAINAGLAKAKAYRIEIEEVTAKRKKYDDYGEEMKWGRG